MVWNAYTKYLVGQLEGKRLIGRPRRRCKDVRMHIKETGCALSSPGSEQWPVAGCCEHCDEPSGSIKDGEFLD